MEHFIEKLQIVNFKSIKNLELEEFRRINLFIGRPNIGKSNILEALSVFNLPLFFDKNSGSINNLIRLKEPSQLFFLGETKNSSIIKAIKANRRLNIKCKIDFDKKFGGLEFSFESGVFFKKEFNSYETILDFDSELNHSGASSTFASNVKDTISFSESDKSKLNDFNFRKYVFLNGNLFKKIKDYKPFLIAPHGDNLEYVIRLNPELREKINSWFSHDGLRLVLNSGQGTLEVLVDFDINGNDAVFILPYSAIADTLQRIIFYKTAVASNENSILIFEEPEAHAFPPYIAEFTQEVINSKTNQFIMATHSPIIVNDFLENAREDLAIFMVDFKDGQTVAKPLSREEVEEVYINGVDLFFNNEAYTH